MRTPDFCALTWKAHVLAAALAQTRIAVVHARRECERAESMLDRLHELHAESVQLVDALHARRRCACPKRKAGAA